MRTNNRAMSDKYDLHVPGEGDIIESERGQEALTYVYFIVF